LLGAGNPPLPPPVKNKQGQGWWQVPAAGRLVALTFDDGPNDKTGALLDALDRAHTPATFFVVGSRAELYPRVLARMRRRGDCVENHSYTHPNMAQSLPDVDEGEILRTSVVIRALTGRYPRFFRPPGGNENRALAALARAYGMALAFWSVDGLGAEDAGSPKAVASWVINKAHPGSIVLLHNGADATIKAIPEMVAGLRARGLHPVTLEQLVAAGRSK
jgi:peptidoglycan/xylan/chitin deacetylase (PgdA/CDA1 family)